MTGTGAAVVVAAFLLGFSGRSPHKPEVHVRLRLGPSVYAFSPFSAGSVVKVTAQDASGTNKVRISRLASSIQRNENSFASRADLRAS